MPFWTSRTTIRTGAISRVDLKVNGAVSVIRMQPDSILELSLMIGSETDSTDTNHTNLRLHQGAIVGRVRERECDDRETPLLIETPRACGFAARRFCHNCRKDGRKAHDRFLPGWEDNSGFSFRHACQNVVGWAGMAAPERRSPNHERRNQPGFQRHSRRIKGGSISTLMAGAFASAR